MIEVKANGISFRVEIEGPSSAPTIILSNSLGTSLEMWNPQALSLKEHYRIIRYDCRGQGMSAVSPGPYSIAQLGQDVLGIMDALDVQRAHWCGLSLGGMIGQWLAANAPSRFDKIILANTTCHYPNSDFWFDRIRAVRDGGLWSIADRVIAGWLTEEFRNSNPSIADWMKAMFLATPLEGYLGTCAALSKLDQRDLLPKLKNQVLVIAGSRDASTPLANAEYIVTQIPGAEFHVLNAAHISNVEMSEEFSRVTRQFLAR